MSAAEDARHAGDFEEERNQFAQATALAQKPKDKSEARYRSAQSWVREGKYKKGAGELEKFAMDYPASIRAARAWLDAGRAWEQADEEPRAIFAYARVVDSYPESGNAGAAARRLVSLRCRLEGTLKHELWRSLLEKNRSSVLDEELRYQHARALEGVSLEEAVLAYQDVARHHPLPRGSYADEALLRASQLRRMAGDSRGAIETLDLLLEQGGKAAFVGSYTRTAYIEAWLLRGRILRDDLDRPEDARRAFLMLSERHPKSRLVDDALWEIIITKKMQGQDTCPGVVALEKAAPESRYLRCRGFLCGESVDTSQAKECGRWLQGIQSAPLASHSGHEDG